MENNMTSNETPVGSVDPDVRQPNEAYFFTTSSLKLALMSVCTFGIYELYWFYKNWALIKGRTGERIMPFWRAFFAPLWAYSCFKTIKASAGENHIQESLSIGLLAFSYFILQAFWLLSGPFGLISFFSFTLLIPANSVAIKINNELCMEFSNNEKFTGWNWVGLIFGGLLFTLTVLGTFSEKAAERDANLGFMYHNGRGVPPDYAQAVTWYRKAADQGHAEAQYNLGVMYAKGEGVPQDDKQAVTWYRKAADQGHAEAQNNLGLIYASGKVVPQDDKQAVTWYRKAADQGNAEAQITLGLMYSLGKGVPQDDKQAMTWYRKAADQGHATAQFNLGAVYDKGQGVPQDYKQAVTWYRKAADQGDADAQYTLGYMYYKGLGVPQDYVQAHMWWNLAAVSELESAIKGRDAVAGMMTPAQLAEAQKLAREWKPTD